MPDWNQLQLPLLAIMVAGYGSGAVFPLLLSVLLKSRHSEDPARAQFVKNLGFALPLISSVAGFFFSLSVILSGIPFHAEILRTLPFGAVEVRVDGLSAFFVLAVSLLAAAVSVYSFGYATEYLRRRHIGLLVFLYNAFLLAIVGVLIAGHGVLFLFVWETMSLTTYFLISYEHEEPASRRAAFLYIVMTHIGTAFLIVMFALLYSFTGSFDFDAIRAGGPRLPENIRSIVFLCATIGFGIKAGVVPFHIWLPEAHPAAPSNVSALMSGVMIKTGIYGMVRVFFGFVGPVIPAWWGILILVLAVVSAVLGVLYALMEHDLKRLLAFHSIENIGIILMGVGGALLFSSLGKPALAGVALIAGLFHVLNHATFKGLLFLGAGSVVHSAHTRNIEDMGGLARSMPWTSALFLVGAVAISALPPLNGFASEWLTFQALLLGFQIPVLLVKIAIPLTVALLALTGALAAACFVKAFGITFLGLPRSAEARETHESPTSMIVAMGFLALLCFVFGLAPGSAGTMLDGIVRSLTGGRMFAGIVPTMGGLVVAQGTATALSPVVLALLLFVFLALGPAVALIVGGRTRSRTAMMWACGLRTVNPRMQYTATGFSKPIRMIFSAVFRASHELEIPEETSAWFQPEMTYRLKTEPVFLKFFYDPLYRLTVRLARSVRRIQAGHIRTYLAYIFITLVILLLFAR